MNLPALRGHRLFLVVLGAYLLFGLYYTFQNPLFLKPDEPFHLGYLLHLSRTGTLPLRNLELGAFQYRDMAEAEAHQPPLYYWLAGLVTRWADTRPEESLYEVNPSQFDTSIGNATTAVPIRDRPAFGPLGRIMYGARLVSLAFGALALLGLYATGLEFLSPRVAVLGTALLAFNPQFIYISTSVSNDISGVALVSLAWWPLLRALRRPFHISYPVIIGFAIGLATLGKVTGLGLLGIWLIVTLVRFRREGTWRWPAAFALSGALALALPLPWLLHNLGHYGDPFGMPVMFSFMGQRSSPPSLPVVQSLLQFIWQSYWVDFSPGGVFFAEPPAYYAMGILVTGGLLGLIVALVRGSVPRLPAVLLSLWFVMVAGSFARYSMQTAIPMGGGRLLFPAALGASLLLAAGLWQIARTWRRERLTVGLAVGLAAWAAVAPTRYIPPLYQGFPLVTEIPPAARQASMQIGEGVELAGYSLAAPGRLTPGGQLEVTLYWQVIEAVDRDYTVFVQLVDAREARAAQIDTYPAYGTFPTRQWRPGDLVQDRYWLKVPAQGDYPQVLKVIAGLYDRSTMERLPVTYPDGSRPASRAIELGAVGVLPASPVEAPLASRLAAPVRFGEALSLLAAQLEPGEAGEVSVTTYWQAEAKVGKDYTIFAHAYDQNGKLAAQVDGPPRQGRFPTSQWPPGDIIADQRRISLPPGKYTIAVGLYDPASSERLPSSYSGSLRSADPVPLGSLTVP